MEYELMLKTFRKLKRMTQEELASLVGVSARKLASWERGETNILFEDAYKCCLVLGCTPNDLCGWPTGKNEGNRISSSIEDELIDCYRESTPEQKDMIMMSARNAALVSKSAAERDPLRRADEAAC